VRSVLLVRPNFRIGNTLLLAPLVPALRERYPRATLDVLTGDRTAALLEGLPIDRVYSISRLFLLRPWRFVALFVRLRRSRYDLVLEGGMGSLSGALYGWLAGGSRRVGADGRGRRLLDVRLAEPRVTHVYDWAPEIARQLGARCEPRPLFAVLPSDRAAAREALLAHDLFDAAGAPLPFVLVFPGGHLKKRWPDVHWLTLCERLARRGARVLVALGPEEHRLRRPAHALAPLGVRLLSPGPIRRLGAVLSRASLVVTADSGPLHLSAAVGAPTIAVLQREASRRYAPRGPLDRWIVAPSVEEAEAAVLAHPRWEELVGQSPESVAEELRERA
jgi:heptosyltransferase-3